MALALTYIGEHNDTSNASEYVFSSVSIGTATADRLVVVATGARKTGAATTITNVDIAGVTATEVIAASTSAANNCNSGIFIAAVPSGATGTITVTLGASMLRCGMSVYTLTGASSTATDTDFDSTADGPTADMDCDAGGCIIGTVFAGSNVTATWTGITEDYDTVVEGAAIFTGGSDEFVSAQTALTCTATLTGNASNEMATFAAFTASAGAAATQAFHKRFGGTPGANLTGRGFW